MKKHLSIFLMLFFFLWQGLGFSQCDHTFTMMDDWGDGWNGATVDITVNGTAVVTGATAAPGAGGGNLSTEDLLFAASTGRCHRFKQLDSWQVL